MAKFNRDELLQKTFHDPANYPYGFSRSGDFSIKDCELLVRYGTLCKALSEGEVEGETDEDVHLRNVILGKDDAISPVERVWLKYQSRIHRPRVGGFNSASEADAEGSERAEVESLDINNLQVDEDP